MGNTKSRKVMKEPEEFFERERWKEKQRKEMLRAEKNSERAKSKATENDAPNIADGTLQPHDEEAIRRMRHQLDYDSEAFLLNNILLSVQFFENYEREIDNLKNTMTEEERTMDEAMLRHHKHVLFPDRIYDCVDSHVTYHRTDDTSEALVGRRMYVIYDNVEAKDPGDTSDYSAVLDAPFYKLCIENSKEPGYVQLKKIEVLESNNSKDVKNFVRHAKLDSDENVFNDTDEMSNLKDYIFEGAVGLIEKVRSNIASKGITEQNEFLNNHNKTEEYSCNQSINNDNKENFDTKKFEKIENTDNFLTDENDNQNMVFSKTNIPKINISYRGNTNKNIFKDKGTSGFSFNSNQTELGGTESKYGYTTITEAATLRRLVIKSQPKSTQNSGVLPDKCWISVVSHAVDDSSDDEINNKIKSNNKKNLYQKSYYLNSFEFMENFTDEFLMNLSTSLGFDQNTLKNSFTQGASVYCNMLKCNKKTVWELTPAVLASWPNTANRWIIRERRLMQNPRTNFGYKWPTKYMIQKTLLTGCLLMPIGFRQKRGCNPYQKVQWKVIFPVAESYLDRNLSHSHARCYLFTLLLYKTFMENAFCRLGVDISHIKHHLYWQCEANYARWSEDRLGETLRLFLRSLYFHLGQAKLPNYFIDHCNEFKNIPTPVLLQFQRKLANILEAPVTHIIYALGRLKYVNKDFYPKLCYKKLFDILTCKNPLQMINPNLIILTSSMQKNRQSHNENETETNIRTELKSEDKYYRWKKEKQRQLHESKKNDKQRSATPKSNEINKNMFLPKRMDMGRRKLILEFFIPHFIAMAQASEKFDVTKQSIIYLKQAQRLCILLYEQPAGDTLAKDYLVDIVRKLSNSQRNLARNKSASYAQNFPRKTPYIEKNTKTNINCTPDLPEKQEKVLAIVDVRKHKIINNRTNISTTDDIEESRL